ncbi:hypothetical protein [Aureimonas sp. Leaf324]|uniref:hypothetical protein n=1 Tax=Aureimonas sp. Leaf324 TaxID=1736336 RepID=UPI0006FEEB72|nr:hypothetical protein [Aureimonas sp. Leaf324]KQQ90986.1 hypothetical protein ASF65_00130 [Aureimonas sp. Leaf324]
MRIRTILLAAVTACAAILSSTAQAAQPDYEGVFVDHCAGGKATCSFDVERRGKTYRLTWQATDRTGRERHCNFTADLVVATGKDIRKHLGRALVGPVEGSGAAVILTVDGDDAVLRTTGGACRSPVGTIEPDGSYDREIGDY